MLATVRDRIRALWRRGLATAAVGLLLALLATGGAGFLAVAAYLALAQVTAPWGAALIVGGTLLGVALLGALGLWLALRDGHAAAPSRPPPAAAGAPADAGEQPVDMAVRLGGDLGRRLGRRGVRTPEVMLGALVVGTVLGASPALRDRLFRTADVRPRQRDRGHC